MNMICQKCGKSMADTQFYTYKDGSKVEMCKKCLTMHIDNFNPETFLWLLEKMDVPYVETEWNVLRDRAYAAHPNKMDGMSVFGKYLSKMKLKQWKDKSWADTEALKEEAEKRKEIQMSEKKESDAWLKQQFEEGKISEAEYRTLMSTAAQQKFDIAAGLVPTPVTQSVDAATGTAIMQQAMGIPSAAAAPTVPITEDIYMSQDDLPDPSADLTEDDKKYLAMKWGRLYRPNEWVELEKYYTDMEASFDIQDADTKSALILICKTNLKMNQFLDQGDLDGFQKLSRVFESLRKSAKFTAAQKKDEQTDFVDSVGEIVSLCEKEGFIPRYATDIPQDSIDKTLQDMNQYVYKLVTQDLGFGQQIEDALRKIEVQKELQAMETAPLKEEEVLPDGLEDEDYEEFNKNLQEQKEHDKELLEGGKE